MTFNDPSPRRKSLLQQAGESWVLLLMCVPAIVFFVIAIIAYVLGARGVAGMSAGVGRTLLFVFIVLAVIVAIVSLMRGGPVV